MCRIILVVSVYLFTSLAGHPALANADLFDQVRQGKAIVLIRHALAPGYSDPAGFDINDCSTQRNLNETGRKQAKAIGDMFRAAGITNARVMTSQWCRCRDTATGMNIGKVEDLPAINSFFQDFGMEDQQTADALNWLSNNTPSAKPLILVTHMVNIIALTGYNPSSGEIVIARSTPQNTLKVLGTIKTQ